MWRSLTAAALGVPFDARYDHDQHGQQQQQQGAGVAAGAASARVDAPPAAAAPPAGSAASASAPSASHASELAAAAAQLQAGFGAHPHVHAQAHPYAHSAAAFAAAAAPPSAASAAAHHHHHHLRAALVVENAAAQAASAAAAAGSGGSDGGGGWEDAAGGGAAPLPPLGAAASAPPPASVGHPYGQQQHHLPENLQQLLGQHLAAAAAGGGGGGDVGGGGVGGGGSLGGGADAGGGLAHLQQQHHQQQRQHHPQIDASAAPAPLAVANAAGGAGIGIGGRGGAGNDAADDAGAEADGYNEDGDEDEDDNEDDDDDDDGADDTDNLADEEMIGTSSRKRPRYADDSAQEDSGYESYGIGTARVIEAAARAAETEYGQFGEDPAGEGGEYGGGGAAGADRPPGGDAYGCGEVVVGGGGGGGGPGEVALVYDAQQGANAEGAAGAVEEEEEAEAGHRTVAVKGDKEEEAAAEDWPVTDGTAKAKDEENKREKTKRDKGKRPLEPDEEEEEEEEEVEEEEELILPPRPSRKTLGDRPRLGEAFKALDQAVEARDDHAPELVEAMRELEAAKRRFQEAAEVDAMNHRLVRERKLEVIQVERDVDCKWNRMFKRLVKFKEENGHCRVPLERKYGDEMNRLGSWVHQQRKMYKQMMFDNKMMEGVRTGRIHRDLQPHRIKALESIGFIWSVREEQWQKKVEDLLEYRARHGDCCIPFKYPPNQSLAYWVHGLRQQYWFYVEGKPSEITEERIRFLESIGFVWRSDFPRTPRKAATEERRRLTEEEEWEECYVLLEQFRNEYGHCKVNRWDKARGATSRQSKRLCTFAAWQRKQYRLYKRGKPSFLNKERIARLEALGFDWSSVSRKAAKGKGKEGNAVKMEEGEEEEEEEDKKQKEEA